MQLSTSATSPSALGSAARYLDRAIAIADASVPRWPGGEYGHNRLNPAPAGLSAARTAQRAVELLRSVPDFAQGGLAVADAQRGIEQLQQFAAANPDPTFLRSDVSIEPYLRAIEALFDARQRLAGY